MYPCDGGFGELYSTVDPWDSGFRTVQQCVCIHVIVVLEMYSSVHPCDSGFRNVQQCESM